MEKPTKSSGLFARIDAEILHAIGLGALLATVGMGMSLVAGTAAIATTTALVAMGVGAAVGITAMVGSVVLNKKAEEAKPAPPAIVLVQAQGMANAPAIEHSVAPVKGAFTQMIEAQRAQQREVAR